MSWSDLFRGLADLLRPSAIREDLRDVFGGVRDLIEGFWNEEAVITRNADKPVDGVPSRDDLSFRS